MIYKQNFLIAAFLSFTIHAVIFLYIYDFAYQENEIIDIKPIRVNLEFEQVKSKTQKKLITESLNKSETPQQKIENNEVVETDFLNSVINSSLLNLISEDKDFLEKSDLSKIEEFSYLIITTIESAWRKPMNIPQGLSCNIRLEISQNGFIRKSYLIKSSGNIRFDNSALQAVDRVDTFNFFDRMSSTEYKNNFQSVVINFNPK